MDMNKQMAMTDPNNLDYESEDTPLCLARFRCGHFCYEPRHHSLGFTHGPCLTLVNVRLQCGHTELKHCFEERRSLGCTICRKVQQITFVYEIDPNNSASNNNSFAAPAEMHLDGQRANEPGSSSTAVAMVDMYTEMDTDSGINSAAHNSQVNSPAPASAANILGQDTRRFGPPLGFGQPRYSTVQTTVVQPERVIRYRLGKRNFDGASSSSGSGPTGGNIGYRRDETSEPETKKYGMDATNAKKGT